MCCYRLKFYKGALVSQNKYILAHTNYSWKYDFSSYYNIKFLYILNYIILNCFSKFILYF